MTIGGAKVALVSEVLDQLLEEYGSETARRSVLFQAALQVCAEESRRIKQGAPPAALDVLVERARAILDAPEAPAPSKPTAPPPSFEEPPMEMTSPPPGEVPVEPSPAEVPLESMGDLFVDEDMGDLGAERKRRLPVLLLLGVIVLLAAAGGTFYVYLNSEGGASQEGGSRIVESYPAPSGAPVDASGAAEQQRPVQAAAVVPTATAAVPMANAPEPTTPPPPAFDRDLPVPVEPQIPAAPGRAAISQGAALMVSPDWEGRTPIFVIHFSSFRERTKAQRDAVAIGKRYGRPAYVARVTLASGVWYRVVLGDFATAESARAFHDELVARRTPGVGGVYRITGP